jgi:hypothetical protein
MLWISDGIFQLGAIDLWSTLANTDSISEISQVSLLRIIIFYRRIQKWQALFLKGAIMIGVLHQQPCRLCTQQTDTSLAGPSKPGNDLLHGAGMSPIDSLIKGFAIYSSPSGSLITFSHPEQSKTKNFVGREQRANDHLAQRY